MRIEPAPELGPEIGPRLQRTQPLDDADPDASRVTEILDAIPGAWDAWRADARYHLPHVDLARWLCRRARSGTRGPPGEARSGGSWLAPRRRAGERGRCDGGRVADAAARGLRDGSQHVRADPR